MNEQARASGRPDRSSLSSLIAASRARQALTGVQAHESPVQTAVCEGARTHERADERTAPTREEKAEAESQSDRPTPHLTAQASTTTSSSFCERNRVHCSTPDSQEDS